MLLFFLFSLFFYVPCFLGRRQSALAKLLCPLQLLITVALLLSLLTPVLINISTNSLITVWATNPLLTLICNVTLNFPSCLSSLCYQKYQLSLFESWRKVSVIGCVCWCSVVFLRNCQEINRIQRRYSWILQLRSILC